MSLPVLLVATSISGFALRDGDRVAMYGDSITEHGYYVNYTDAAIATRFPGLNVEFFNVGWAGDTSWGQYGWDGAGGSPEERIKRDVAPLKPTVITVMLGMNDSGYVPYDSKIEQTFETTYRALILGLRQAAPGARFTLVRTSPWDDFTRPPSFTAGIKGEGGYNAVLLKYGEKVKKIAGEIGAQFVDFNVPMSAAMARAAKVDAKMAQQIIPDWIHPSLAGGLLMSAELLKGWGLPSVVSEVHLDLKRGQVVDQKNTKIDSVNGLTWNQLDASLPFPIDPDDKVVQLALRSSDILETLDRQVLKASGLPEGNYKVKIDGDTVRTATDRDLAVGINLAALSTPMLKQSLDVLNLTEQANMAWRVRWREIDFRYPKLKSTAGAAKAMEEVRRELLAERRRAAAPRSHHFELVPIGE